MKHILSILTLVLLATAAHSAQAQDRETYRFILHYNNDLVLTYNTNNTASWGTKSTTAVTQTNQLFYIQRNANQMALIISLEDPTKALKRGVGNAIEWGTPSSDTDAAYLWSIDYTGEDASGNGLCMLTDPANALSAVAYVFGRFEMYTFSATSFASPGGHESFKDGLRMHIEKAYNTF